MQEIEEIIEFCDYLVKQNKPRVQDQDAMEKAFLLDRPDMEGAPDYIKEMRDPQPHNSVVWAAGSVARFPPDPRIEIPSDVFMDEAAKKMQSSLIIPSLGRELVSSEDKATERADVLENLLRVIFQHNDLRQPSPLFRDLLLSAFIYSDIVAKVVDLRYYSAWKGRDMKGKSPIAITAPNPKTIFADWDSVGVCKVLERNLKTWAEIKKMFPNYRGQVAFEPTDLIVYNCYTTEEQIVHWFGKKADEIGEDEPIDLAKEHVLENKENALGFIPYVIKRADGSNLFESEQAKRLPILYAGVKSDLFRRTNLMLSVLVTVAFAMANDQYIHYKENIGDPTVKLNKNQPSVHGVSAKDKVERLDQRIPSDVKDVVQMMLSQSELASVQHALGTGAGFTQAPAALFNMVLHSAEVKLNPAQIAVGDVYVGITEKVWEWIRAYDRLYGEEGDELKLWIRSSSEIITGEMIPEWMDIQYIIKSSLPQDKVLMARLAMDMYKMLDQTGQPFISKESAWEISNVIDDKGKEKRRLAEEQKKKIVAPPLPQQKPNLQGMPQPVEQNPELPVMEQPQQVEQQMMGAMPPQGAYQ